MLRLQRLLLRELLTSFLLLLLIVTGVFVAGTMLQALHRYADVGLVALLRSLPLAFPQAFVATAPVSFLMACLLTYGRFSDDNEFLALQMGGLHPWHAVAPALLSGVGLCFLTLYFGTTAAPLSKLAQKEMLKDQVELLVSQLEDPRRRSIWPNEKLQMSWSGRDDEGWYENVLLSLRYSPMDGEDSGDETRLIAADRAALQTSQDDDQGLVLTLVLEGAEFQDGAAGSRTLVRHERIPFQLPVAAITDVPRSEQDKSRDEMRSTELLYRMQRGTTDDKLMRKWATEFWSRFSIGLSPLALGLLGAVLGLVGAKGTRGGAVVAALVIAMPVYYPLLLWGENLSLSGALPSPLALSLGNLVVGTAGVLLLVRVVRR